MGKRGPRPARQNTITTPPAEPACPAWLGAYGQLEHARASAELKAQGRLTRDCAQVLEGIAAAYQLFRVAEDDIEANGLAHETQNGRARNPSLMVRTQAAAEWARWLHAAGLTPQGLRVLKVPAKDEGDDDFAQFRVTG